MPSRSYSDPAGAFALELPADWLLEPLEQGPLRMACVAPESVQGFAANVNVGVHLLAPLTPDEYLLLCRLQLRQLSGLRELPVDAPAEPPAHWFEWANPRAPLPLRVRQLATFGPRHALVVTATALERNFEDYRPTFDDVFASFRVPP